VASARGPRKTPAPPPPEHTELKTWTLEPTPAPPAPPQPLTLEVTLNGRDAGVILELAELEYRTPAQQVG
jgi:hypothetical protein